MLPAHDVEPAGENDLVRALVRRAQAGDRQAWASLYRQSYRRVLRRLTYLVGDPDRAEDLAQEVYLQGLAGLASYDARSPFEAWLLGIAHNLARKHWRARESTKKAHRRLDEREIDDAADPERAQLARQRILVLQEVLAELPDTLREVFVLRDLERVSARDIATVLEISDNAVMIRASRARARVRELLVQRGELPAAVGARPA